MPKFIRRSKVRSTKFIKPRKSITLNEMRVMIEAVGPIKYFDRDPAPADDPGAFCFTMWSGGESNLLDTDFNRIYSSLPEYTSLSANFQMCRVISMQLEVSLVMDFYTLDDNQDAIYGQVVGGQVASGSAAQFPDQTPPISRQLQSMDYTKLISPGQGVSRTYLDVSAKDKKRGLPDATVDEPANKADSHVISVYVGTTSPIQPGASSTVGLYVAKWLVHFTGRTYGAVA